MGGLLVVRHSTQAKRLHELPKRKRVTAHSARINLTFRCVQSS